MITQNCHFLSADFTVFVRDMQMVLCGIGCATWNSNLVCNLKVSQFRKQIVKLQILPKNEQMNLFLLLYDVFSFIFLEEIEVNKQTFRNQLTFSMYDVLRNESWQVLWQQKRYWYSENNLARFQYRSTKFDHYLFLKKMTGNFLKKF